MIKTINKNTIHINDNTKSQKCPQKYTNSSIRKCIEAYKKSRKASRIDNSTAYNKSLVERGKVSLLVSPEVFLPPRHKKGVGRKQEYSDALILFLAALREITQRPFRQTIGYASDLAVLQNVKLPSYNRLCVRMQELQVTQKLDRRHFKKVCVLVDSTGLKTKGEGEWKVRKHGPSYRRGWTKLHLALDEKTQIITAHEITPETIVDQEMLPALLDNTLAQGIYVDTTIGDGAYGSHKLYKQVEEERGIHLLSPPYKNAKLHVRYKETHPGRGGSGGKYAEFVDEEGWETHNKYLKECLVNGWDEWKDKTGYHRRSLVETTMSRLKNAFSDKLKSTSLKNQKVEVAIRIKLLNRWTMQNQAHYKAKKHTTT